MLKEYDCWLQRWASRFVPESELIPKTVYMQEGGEVAAQAAAEYCLGIQRLLGFSPDILKQRPEEGERAALLDIAPSPDNAAESFVIKVTDRGIVITGNDEPGLLYGVFRFLALLVLGEIKHGFISADSPASSLRIINHWDNFDGTVERGYAGLSLFYKDGRFDYDKQRIEDYARLLASVGVNRVSINNVNVRAQAKLLITEEYLPDAAALAAIFRRFGIRLFFCVNFGAPWSLGKLSGADPLDPQVAAWWKERASLVYRYIPDLAGFLVKADSEGEPGPFQYNRTHADGANMLAKAVKPFGGEIVWRCFVYNCTQDWRDHDTDRARAAYDHFMPQDGAFDENVILQIKSGPYDFQVREPVSPLFGALKKTRHIMELQITQEYTGQQIDLCYLPEMWESVMNFDTACGENSRIRDLASRREKSGFEGFAAVANTGQDNNWTGHSLAQANLFGYGRIAWNPGITAAQIADEWSTLCFGRGDTSRKVKEILLKSYRVYEKYTSPFGVCFMVNPGHHYGPNIEGYEYSRWGTYHRAGARAIGIDRTQSGTGYTGQYSPKNAALFADTQTCPENLILFFHRLNYDYRMKNGQTLLQNIYDTHFEGYEEAAALKGMWEELENEISAEVYQSVLLRFERQLVNAREWRDQVNTYFYRKTGIADQKSRRIYE
ncbi:MAG: alpha-glucuronidase [Treponema sp.]|jgi:alpha-glucuronidase|nr:alpha-glucuronidase [Treponema sp.]